MTSLNENADILRQDKNGVATLTLNRPEARNALSFEMMGALIAAFKEVESDPAVRVVVLAANGPGFCSGHDLKEIRTREDEELYRRLFERCATLMKGIVRLKKPVIAKVHGMATAAGCQIVASCDLAIASSQAKFGTPGVNIGLFCSTPMVALSRSVGNKAAMEMLLTGIPASAEDAFRFGLVNRVVAPDQLDEAVTSLAEIIAQKSSLTLEVGKEAFYRQKEMGLDEAYEYASDVMVRNLFTYDAREGIDAFLEKRAPEWRDK